MRRITTITELRTALADERRAGRTVALVPTLGALHEGHLANVRIAGRHADVVVVSVFVNPTQFDRPDDLAAYPRTLEADEAALRGLGDAVPAYVFAPAEQEMYPRPPRTSVHVAGVTEVLEGASRAGHFDGVATVVAKLFNIVGPDVAIFGRKDFQQNLVIGRLVADLDLPVRLVLAPTVREADGLALSSRNQRLHGGAREAAAALAQALRAGVVAARDDRTAGRPVDPKGVLAAVLATLDRVPAVVVDYVEVVDPDTLAPADAPRGEAAGSPSSPPTTPGPSRHLLVAVAAFVTSPPGADRSGTSPGDHQAGAVRLIDNVEIGNEDDEERLLAATDPATPHP